MIQAACWTSTMIDTYLVALATDPAALQSDSWFVWLEPLATVLLAVLLVALCLAAWSANLIALPGNWLAVVLLACYAWLGPQEGRAQIGSISVLLAAGLALVGELLEFAASAMGAQRAGASRRATLLALVGSITGALLGAVVGLPIPLVGPILAAILFAGLGATAGAMYGEWTNGKPWRENWTIGHAAFWGRTVGTMAKISVGFIIFLVSLVAVVV